MADTKPALPNNWRKTLAKRVKNHPIPELTFAFDEADAILAGRSEVEVQKLAQEIMQSIALTGDHGAVAELYVIALNPREIFIKHFNGDGSMPGRIKLIDHLAVASLVTIARACDVLDNVKAKTPPIEVANVISNARALHEWIYVISVLSENEDAFETMFPRQLRKVVKKKKSAKASKKAKDAWDKSLVLKSRRYMRPTRQGNHGKARRQQPKKSMVMQLPLLLNMKSNISGY